MRELYKRWTSTPSGWKLRAKIEWLHNRALIRGPTRAGYYSLYIWVDETTFGIGDWELHMKSKDLSTVKAIGRIEAARRLNV